MKSNHKIVITHSSTKRELQIPFNICGSKEDLFKIANMILKKIKNDFSYGWVEIKFKKSAPSIKNTYPSKWDL